MPTTSPIKVPIIGDDQLTAKMDKLQNRVKRFSAGMEKVGRGMTKFLTVPIVATGAASLKFAMDFNEAMARVATLIPGNIQRIEELKKGIIQLSIESGISTDDLAEGTYAAISAWGDGADTLERLRVVAQAAQAGIASTKETLGLFATITENYGDSTAEATERVADFAFVTNKLAKEAPFSEMASSMGKVVPIAKKLNVSQEDLFSTLAAGAGITGNVAEVVTQMRSLYTTALKETPQMEKIVKKAGFGSAEEMIGKLGTKGYIDVVKKNTKGTKEFTKAMGGRTEGLVLAFAIAGARAGKYNEALKEMTDRSGQMKIAHKEITSGINKTGFEYDRAKARMMAMAIRMGDKLLPMVEKLVKTLEPWIEKLEDLDDAQLKFYLKMAGAVAAGGPMVLMIGKAGQLTAGIIGIAKAFKTAKDAQKTFAIAQAAAKYGQVMPAGYKGTGKGGQFYIDPQGLLARNVKDMSKTLKGGLTIAGGSIAAAIVGWEIGSAISVAIFEPWAEKEAEQRDAAENQRRAVEETLRYGTEEERLQGVLDIQKNIEKMPGAIESPEDVAGLALSLVDETLSGYLINKVLGLGLEDVESPFERYDKERERQVQLMEKLNASITTWQSPEAREKRSKLTIEIKDDNNMTMATPSGAPMKRSPTGFVMDT